MVAPAQEKTTSGTTIPVFWDAKERLPKPDLSAMTRLRFLTTTDFPPFNFLDAEGRLSGFHVDLARAICTALDIAEKCQIQALPWTEIDGALARDDGEAVIAGIAITERSRERYGFSRPYLQFPARFVMAKAAVYAEPLDVTLKGKQVGVIAGSGHEKMLRTLFPDILPRSYPNQETLYAELKAGRIDAGFADGMRLAFWLATEAGSCCDFVGGPYLAPEYFGQGLAVAARADDPALVAAFDYALQQITASGAFAELYLRYFPIGFY